MSESKIKVPADGRKITMGKDGRLQVPDRPILPFIEGDGTGADITRAAMTVWNAAVAKAYSGKRQVAWMEIYAGEKANEVYGPNTWLPPETLTACRDYLVSIKGPLTTPVGGGIRSLNVALRQELDLYVCLRPVRWFAGVPSPVKHPEKTDMVIFRENSEDIYAGIEWAAYTAQAQKVIDFLQKEMGVKKIRFPASSGIGIKPVSEEGTRRLVRAAIRYALENGRQSVTLVHKGNIMKFTEGAFRNWGYEIAEKEFAGETYTWDQWERTKKESGSAAADAEQKAALAAGKVLIKDAIADITLQQVLTRPDEFDVIATLNLNGDYLSDALAAQVGGIGIAPGGNVNYVTGHAVFEATHGTAPKYADLDKVNPGSVVLSGEMMLRYMGWTEAADLVIKGMDGAIAGKRVTYDFARVMEGATEVKCSEFGDEVIACMG